MGEEHGSIEPGAAEAPGAPAEKPDPSGVGREHVGARVAPTTVVWIDSLARRIFADRVGVVVSRSAAVRMALELAQVVLSEANWARLHALREISGRPLMELVSQAMTMGLDQMLGEANAPPPTTEAPPDSGG